jgi:hypothetical protein
VSNCLKRIEKDIASKKEMEYVQFKLQGKAEERQIEEL